MRFSTSVLSSAALLSTANAAYKGFNYGSTFTDSSAKQASDFAYEFNAAKALPDTDSEFTSARLYTMIQGGTTNTPISAIEAAIQTKTYLLLGMWTSGGNFDNELAAFKSAITQYGSDFADLVVGISVGSEDLYRISPTGIENNSGVGVEPAELVSYITQVKSAISGTALSSKPVGHVDTWTAYVNASNNAVIDACDFLGVDMYPYFQNTMANSIEVGNETFYAAYDATVAVAGGKPVWVTETGWPVSGPTENQAVASIDNARIYWEDVACSLMAKGINFFWYILQDAQPTLPSPSFGIMPSGDLDSVKPLYSLTCPGSLNSTSAITGNNSTSSTYPSGAAGASGSPSGSPNGVPTGAPYGAPSGALSGAPAPTAAPTGAPSGPGGVVQYTTIVKVVPVSYC